jgi:sulfur carrier protein
MKIILNGEAREIRGVPTVAGLIDDISLVGRRIAVEVNEEIVPRSQYPGFQLRDGDRVEIVHAIGGG